MLFSIALVVPGCDARKLFGESWTEAKNCQVSNPDCVFQTGSGTKQQICEVSSGQCRACGKGPAAMSSFDLVGGTKECRDSYQTPIVCDAMTNECRACRVGNQECLNSDKSKPVCDTGTGTCRACTSGPAGATECKLEGFITCSGGLCQPCALNTDCVNIDPNTPYCDKGAGTAPTCRGCNLDSECDSQLCDNGKNPLVSEGKAGRCADKLSLAWVDSNAGCSAAMADGSDTKPFCTIAAALGKAGVKYLLLKSSGTPYPMPATINKEVSIFGKGADPSQVTVAAIAFNGPGTKLGLNNLTVKDTGKALVQCSGGSVTLLKTVLDGGSRGLDASGGCTEVNVQQTKVTNATGAGLYIAGSTKYTVINTGVFKTAQGGGEGDAITLTTTGTGKFAFNTIRTNGNNTAVGGINCGSGANKLLANSVFVGNSTGGTSQLMGSCQLTKVVVGVLDQTTTQGAIKENPKFVGVEGTLDPSDTACIDKGDADAAVTVDFFGGARPLGNAPDIGYHEAK
ncbi:MAG: hypothetical protein JNM83_21780 [Myxococcales bacterium]|nr:hypothetical protein [Myxococcales bacterium]